MTEMYDPHIVCPYTQRLLSQDVNKLIGGDREYKLQNNIAMLYADHPMGDNAITHRVQEFYTQTPFPDYNDVDDIHHLIRRAEHNVFTRLLRDALPANGAILELGSGTAQLSNYLAATASCRVYAADISLASLQLGQAFAERNHIQGIRFLHMNLFMPAIRLSSMDVVIANGVLHHTGNSKNAFFHSAALVKPGGHIIIGLYSSIGRLRTRFRRTLLHLAGTRALWLDPYLRTSISVEKRRAWITDQYHHPQETTHSISETLSWFEEAGIEFVSSLPPITSTFNPNIPLFTPQPSGSAFERACAEFAMLFSRPGQEGGLFICIGRKKAH